MNTEALCDLLRHARGDDVRVARELRIDRTGGSPTSPARCTTAEALRTPAELGDVGDVAFDQLEVRVAAKAASGSSLYIRRSSTRTQ